MTNNNNIDKEAIRNLWNGLYDDLTSNKPYKQKKYLQIFDKISNQNNYCSNNYKCSGNKLQVNYYGSNNVQITGLNNNVGYYGSIF